MDLCIRLVKAVILNFPDHSRVFIVYTNVSAKGVRTLLSQKQGDGTEKVIGYVRKALTRPECNYSVT